MKKFILLMLMAVSLSAPALEIAKRPGKATNEILIFPQLEAHYGTFQNFLHYWKDRPLYVNPAHRYEGNQFTFTTELSVMKQIELAKSYNVAGLSPLGGMSTSQGLFNAAEKNDVKDFRILPAVYLPGITYASAAKPAELYKVLRRSIASNKVFRINGKGICIVLNDKTLFLFFFKCSAFKPSFRVSPFNYSSLNGKAQKLLCNAEADLMPLTVTKGKIYGDKPESSKPSEHIFTLKKNHSSAASCR